MWLVYIVDFLYESAGVCMGGGPITIVVLAEGIQVFPSPVIRFYPTIFKYEYVIVILPVLSSSQIQS